jgi:exocyst complex component 5
MTNYSSTNIAALEKKVNHIFQTVYEIVISSSSHRLSKQRKNDFKLREDDGSLTNLQTEPCRNVTSFWNRAYQAIHPILEGRNNDLFFTELGLGFHSLLLEHFKKFTINAAGGLILTKYCKPYSILTCRDIALYYSTIETWKIPALSEPFELLRELGNVFVVKYVAFWGLPHR